MPQYQTLYLHDRNGKPEMGYDCYRMRWFCTGPVKIVSSSEDRPPMKEGDITWIYSATGGSGHYVAEQADEEIALLRRVDYAMTEEDES